MGVFEIGLATLMLAFVGVAWLKIRKWETGDDEEQVLLEEWEETAPLLEYILSAPDSEFEGMSLTEAMAVTRAKKEAAECARRQ